MNCACKPYKPLFLVPILIKGEAEPAVFTIKYTLALVKNDIRFARFDAHQILF
jgi:hypothetical protein